MKKEMKKEKRLIDANALLDYLRNEMHESEVIEAVKDAPTVDAVEVVHGRWEYHDPVSPNCFCSVCHYDAPWDDFGDYHSVRTNYCPNCGADMRERKDNG